MYFLLATAVRVLFFSFSIIGPTTAERHEPDERELGTPWKINPEFSM